MKYRLTETGAFQTELEYGTLTISGNSELGFRPFQLLVSSIAGCSGSVFKKILEKKKIAYDDIEIDARVERDEKQANKVTKIELQFTVNWAKSRYRATGKVIAHRFEKLFDGSIG